MYQTHEPTQAEVGQMWSDNDPRATYQEFTILEVLDSGFVRVKRGPRTTTIAIHRLLKSAHRRRGYTYLGMSK